MAARPTPRLLEMDTRRNAVIAEFATNVPAFWNEVAMLVFLEFHEFAALHARTVGGVKLGMIFDREGDC